MMRAAMVGLRHHGPSREGERKDQQQTEQQLAEHATSSMWTTSVSSSPRGRQRPAAAQ
jgi:hypothetical protein